MGDAPIPPDSIVDYTVQDCLSVCTYDADGAELTCDLGVLGCEQKPSPGWMHAVKFASGNAQFTAFGSCADTPSDRHFCCKVTDPGGEIARVTLLGRDEQEEPIGFRWTNPGQTMVKNFVPTHDQGTGAYAWGRGAGDVVFGSDYGGSDYFERLYGEGGADDIFTHEGGGRAFGGDGDDDLYGGSGADRLEGGHGTDELFGFAGNDVLLGGTGQFDVLDGGANDDVLCDTRVPASPGIGCPLENYFYGGSGYDKAFSYLYVGCNWAPSPGVVVGSGVEIARPATLNWETSVLVAPPNGTEEANTTPWPECL